MAPLVRGQKGEHRDLFADLLKQGFARARVDGRVIHLSDDLRLDRQMRHNIEVVVDRLVAGPKVRPRLAEAVELALRLGDGNLVVAEEGREERGEGRGGDKETGRRRDDESVVFSESPNITPSPSPLSPLLSPLTLSAHYACTHCGLSFEPPSPQLFSFNSPQGMCPECDGLGQIYTFDSERLISDPARSFQQGCIELVGAWRDMGRWRRHIYRGVADTLERKSGLPPGAVLETAWEELDPATATRPALGHRRRAHHLHLAQRHGRAQMGRPLRGHHPQVALAVSNHSQPDATPPVSRSTCAFSTASSAAVPA